MAQGSNESEGTLIPAPKLGSGDHLVLPPAVYLWEVDRGKVRMTIM